MNKIIILNITIICIIIYLYLKNINTDTSIIYKPVSISCPINKRLFPKKFMIETVLDDPKIYYLHNFLKDEEANHMIDMCEMYKESSTIENDNKDVVNTNYRTSLTAYLKKGMTDIIKLIENRAANFANVDYERIEALQCVVYEKNQYFKSHLDSFGSNSPYLLKGGHRISTIFVYLSTINPEENGCTYFNKLKLKIRPIKCNAIYFENIKDGKVDERLLHEGEKPNTKKYCINIWIRERAYLEPYKIILPPS